MPKRSAARDAALQHAKARERAAGKKISRNEAKGINLGTDRDRAGRIKRNEYDPRVGAQALEQMSTRELKAHTRRVDAFVSRNTQFVAAFAGSPVPRSMWNEYKRLEAINNERADAFMTKYGEVKLPGQDQTVQGREEMTRPARNERGRVKNQGRVHERIERDASTIMGTEGVQTLIDSMRKKARGDYTERTVNARLNSGRAVLRYSGNADLIEAVNALTSEQKQLLIDASTFFDIALEQFDSPDKSEVSEVLDANYEEHEGIAKNIHVREELEAQLQWVRESAPRNERDARGRFVKRGTGTNSATRRSRRR